MATNEAKKEEIKKAYSLSKKYGPYFALVGILIFIIILISSNFFENIKEDRGSIIFWSAIGFTITPWIIAEWLIKIKILK
jgi:hypothetical protein